MLLPVMFSTMKSPILTAPVLLQFNWIEQPDPEETPKGYCRELLPQRWQFTELFLASIEEMMIISMIIVIIRGEFNW